MRIAVYILLLFGILSCRQDNIVKIPKKTDTPDFPSSITETHLIGTVVDQNYQPIPDCSLKIRNASCSTKQDGSFTLSNIYVGTKGDVISATKPGYFDTYSPIYPLPNQRMNTQIQMIQKTNELVFNPGEKIVIPYGNGGSIEIPPYSLLTASGEVVYSDIHVFYYEAYNLCNSICMPINMETSFENQKRILPSWLFLLSVEDKWGNPLELSGSETISLVPPTINNQKDQLFQYSSSLQWASLRLKGNSPLYLSSIPSRLCLGEEYAYVLAKGDIYMDSLKNNNPQFSQSLFAIHSLVNNHQSVTTLSSTSSQFILPIKAFSDTKMQISTLCNNVVAVLHLPAYNLDDHPDINIPILPDNIPNKMRVSGFAKNNAGAYVSSGLVLLSLDNGLVYKQNLDRFGHFSILTQSCESRSFKIKVYDTDSMVYSEFTKPINHYYSFTPVVKTPLEEYLYIQIDSTISYLYEKPVFDISILSDRIRFTTKDCCDFGSIDLTYNQSNTNIISASFTTFDQKNIIIELDREDLKQTVSTYTIIRNTPTDFVGKLSVSNIRDIYGIEHHITLRFKYRK